MWVGARDCTCRIPRKLDSRVNRDWSSTAKAVHRNGNEREEDLGRGEEAAGSIPIHVHSSGSLFTTSFLQASDYRNHFPSSGLFKHRSKDARKHTSSAGVVHYRSTAFGGIGPRMFGGGGGKVDALTKQALNTRGSNPNTEESTWGGKGNQ